MTDRAYYFCPKCLSRRLYRRNATRTHPWGFYCAAKGCTFVTAPDDRDAPPPQPTEKRVGEVVEKARAKIEHWSQWKNEASAKKKIAAWKRRLKRALVVATELSIKVPQPPPPPPTEEELRQRALKAVRHRALSPWLAQQGTKAWAPWGTTGWSAVEITRPHRKWAKVRRVNPKTQEKIAIGKVRVDYLVRRRPEHAGKDKPEFEPLEVFPSLSDAEEKPVETPKPSPTESTSATLKPALPPERIESILDLLEDDSTTDDW